MEVTSIVFSTVEYMRFSEFCSTNLQSFHLRTLILFSFYYAFAMPIFSKLLTVSAFVIYRNSGDEGFDP